MKLTVKEYASSFKITAQAVYHDGNIKEISKQTYIKWKEKMHEQ